MSHDPNKLSPEEAIAMGLAAHRGELSPEDRASYRAQLQRSDASAQLMERTDDMLDAASTLEDDAWGQASADDLFARIASELEGDAPASNEEHDSNDAPTSAEATTPEPAPSLPLPLDDQEPPSDDGRVIAFPRRRSVLWGAVAACIGALIAWRVLAPSDGDVAAPAPAEMAHQSDAPDGASPRGTSPDAPREEQANAMQIDPRAIASLAPADSGLDAVRILSSDAAVWSVEGGPSYQLSLREGAVLVEFVGDGRNSLTVASGDWSAKVVGTVFYAEAGDEPDIRVLVGAVDVRSADEARIVRVDGGAAFQGDTLRALDGGESLALAGYVDPGEHQAELDAAREARVADEQRAWDQRRLGERGAEPARENPERNSAAGEATARENAEQRIAAASPPADGRGSQTPPETAPDVRSDDEEDEAPPSLSSGELGQLARDAQRRRDWASAAEHYEAWLRQTPVGAGAGAVRLDLARIYLRRLDDPAGAYRHLESFLRSHPDDVAAPMARDEFCRVARTLGRTPSAEGIACP